MATRHQAREAVIGLLYAYDLGNPEIKKFAKDILEDKKIRNKQREFALSLFDGTTNHLDKIDEELKKHLKDWDFDRVGFIERAILRLGAYEMIYCDLDKAIVINEAVELAKKLGSEKSSKFINGILDAVAKDLEGKESETKQK